VNKMISNPAGIDIADVADALRGRKVLVTGGSGFIGGRLIERLLIECGAHPRVLLRNYSRAAKLARFGLDNIEIVIGSLTDPASLGAAVEGCSVVFHCAYERGDLKSNTTGVQAMIDACIAEKARLVHVSSFGVYEPLPNGDLTEDTKPVRSGIPYSETKLDVEETVLQAVQIKGLDATVIMPTLVYGPNSKTWTLLPASQLQSGTVLLPENGQGLCNVVYVDDLCQALIRAGVAPAARGRRYLISGESPVTWFALFKGYADELKVPGPQALDNVEFRKRKAMSGVKQWAKKNVSPSLKALLKKLYGMMYRNVGPARIHVESGQRLALYISKCHVRIDRAKAELGYQPAFDLNRAMQTTGAWLRWMLPPES